MICVCLVMFVQLFKVFYQVVNTLSIQKLKGQSKFNKVELVWHLSNDL